MEKNVGKSDQERAERLAEEVAQLKERLQRETDQRQRLEALNTAFKERLRQAEERAEQATRLKSSLLANMSHELRTPLTSMMAHAAILAKKLDGDLISSVEAIKRGGNRLTETLNSVLTLAQLEGKALEPAPEDIDLVEVVTEAVESFRVRADHKNLELRADITSETMPMHCDPRCLRRILHNLIGNAIKFTEQGEVIVSLAADNGLILRVQDTGPGIAPDFLEEVFDEFTQESCGLTRTHEGSGLGLAITKRLVEALGGCIEVQSQKGEGTVFTVRLPMEPERTQCGACARPAQSSSPSAHADAVSRARPENRAHMSVLLVEDNLDVRSVLEQLLESVGEIVTAANAESALEQARATRFDVVVMDISLPKMSGVQALKKLRQMDGYDEVPVIAMTGHALPGDRERFLDLGFTDYIGKPFPPSALLKKLRRRVTG